MERTHWVKNQESWGEGNGSPLQYSCLENRLDRGAWLATVHGVVRVRHELATKPPLLRHVKEVFQIFKKKKKKNQRRVGIYFMTVSKSNNLSKSQFSLQDFLGNSEIKTYT